MSTSVPTPAQLMASLPTAPAPISAATVHTVTAPVFQSYSGEVTMTTPQTITVAGGSPFGGVSIYAPPSAASASVVPPQLPPPSAEIYLAPISLNVPTLATNYTVTVQTFASEEGAFQRVIPYEHPGAPNLGDLPVGASQFATVTFNNASAGGFSLTSPKQDGNS